MLKKIKQQILAFVLRQGKKLEGGKTYGTIAHIKWLKSLDLTGLPKETLSEYLVTYEYLTEKIERLDHRIEELASGEKYKEKVKNMGCFLGIKTHTALSMVVEIGGHKSIALKERQQGCSVEVIAYADKANERLRRRFYKMTLNKGINRNVAATAIARELACFMWGMATGNIG